jgi:hypothetical protein
MASTAKANVALLDYAELVATVRELILGTGRTVTFGRMSAAVADSAKPWKPGGTPDAVDTHATFVPVGSAQDLGLMIVDDELARRTSQVCLVAPHADADLRTFHTVTDSGVVWRIEWVQVLRPGDTELLIAMGVRQ